MPAGQISISLDASDFIAQMDALNQDLEAVQDQIDNLNAQRRLIKDEMNRVRRLRTAAEGGRREPAVTDEQILEAVKALGGGPVSSQEVAEHLGVTSRNTASKLRKLVDAHELIGNVGLGYRTVQL